MDLIISIVEVESVFLAIGCVTIISTAQMPVMNPTVVGHAHFHIIMYVNFHWQI